VLLGERKLAGILAEARAPEWAVLGIGVNVTAVPPEVADIAAALGRDDVEPALQELLQALTARLEQPPPQLLADLRERDALLGRRLRWAGGEGVGAGIDDAGALLVARADGTTAALSSGEVLLAG
jgi:BirA family biotin operon repressor/biotin-[acetyl-CoA-carboxylase] ligase